MEKHTDKNLLSEPAVAYVTQGNIFASILGNSATQYISDYNLLQHTRKGLSKHILLLLAKRISITLNDLANIMHISERTLQRYDDDAIVKPEYTEKAVELARLYTRGEEVFGSLEKFKLWMKTPLYIFKGETPISLLDTSIGFGIVFKELGRIEHGIFA